MPRILSEHGNVVAVDFRPRPSLNIKLKTEILYADDLVGLARVTYEIDGKPGGIQHFMVDLTNS